MLPRLTFHVSILSSIAHVKAKSWQVLVISIYISQWRSSSLKLTFIHFAPFSAVLLVLYLPVCRIPWMLSATLRVPWCMCHKTLSVYRFPFPRVNHDFLPHMNFYLLKFGNLFLYGLYVFHLAWEGPFTPPQSGTNVLIYFLPLLMYFAFYI